MPVKTSHPLCAAPTLLIVPPNNLEIWPLIGGEAEGGGEYPALLLAGWRLASRLVNPPQVTKAFGKRGGGRGRWGGGQPGPLC